jgi:[FeFe] hydrogenase H-cluster maturation GTPase HydF
MNTTPKSLRLQIGLFGRTNVGKSSFLNLVAGQDVSITSPEPGTTTDIVEKAMEFHSLGPVVFLDTAGINDDTALGELRWKKTEKVFDRSDVTLLITEPNHWTSYEEQIVRESQAHNIPCQVVVNKIDLATPSEDFLARIRQYTDQVLMTSSIDTTHRQETVTALEQGLMKSCAYDIFGTPQLMADLVPQGGLVMLLVPIDQEAPKGRIKMLQAQVIREALDHNIAAVVVKEENYEATLHRLTKAPDLVICDSPLSKFANDTTPESVPVTTFSILMSRYKGDLIQQVRGVCAIPTLQDHSRVLIAEACTHHAIDEDIGRVKIPGLLKRITGKKIDVEVCSGRDFSENLGKYQLIIHCGACMLARREMLSRIRQATEAGVPITNYGLSIAYLQGVIERVLVPFPVALEAYRQGIAERKTIAPCFSKP